MHNPPMFCVLSKKLSLFTFSPIRPVHSSSCFKPLKLHVQSIVNECLLPQFKAWANDKASQMFNWQPSCFSCTTFKGRCGYSNVIHMQCSQLQHTNCMHRAYRVMCMQIIQWLLHNLCHMWYTLLSNGNVMSALQYTFDGKRKAQYTGAKHFGGGSRYKIATIGNQSLTRDCPCYLLAFPFSWNMY